MTKRGGGGFENPVTSGLDLPQGSSGKRSKNRYTLAAFRKFCNGLELNDGSKMTLEPFEARILKEHFQGAEEALVLLPKKNYKTTLMAVLALFHLDAIDEAEVVMGAASRDQARLMLEQASAIAERNDLPHVIRWREIRHNGGRMRAMAADANTGDGVIPTLALVDELHRHPNAELYGVFRDGLVARNGQMVTISTAGYNSDSPLGQLRSKAYKMPTFKRKGVYNHAISSDGAFVMHEWCLTDDDDLTNIKLVKKANPARHHTISTLRRRFESPSMTPARWARFACGIWTEGDEVWLEGPKWDALKVDIGLVKESEPVWAAVNAGTNPAIVIAAPRADEAVAVKAFCFEGQIPLEVVENKLVELFDRYSVQEIAYDRVGFLRSAELLEARGLPMMELPHSPERMSIVSTTLLRLIEDHKLRHDGDPELRTQVLSSATKETERGWRLVQTYRNRALIAMAVAAHQATAIQTVSAYEDRGMENG